MYVTTTNDLPGFRVTRNIGLVRGVTVRSRNAISDAIGGVQSMLGGRVGAYVKLAEAGRQEAYDELVKHAQAHGANAINVSFAAMDPFFGMVRFASTKTFPPVSNNWGYYGNPEIDAIIAEARTSFDDTARDAALAKLHTRMVDDAPFVWIAHDVGPRAISPKVKGVVQPQSWFIDIATMSME